MEESEKHTEEAKEQGEEWAREGDAETATYVLAMPGYDMDMDAFKFQQHHMQGFQSDLSEYVALMAEADDLYYLPKLFHDAMKHADLWWPPMEQEMGVMTRRAVFSKVERPKDKKVIGLKWIYGFKYNVDGEIMKRKACLVAQGFNQIPGVDFNQTYASVACLESMRMCIAITVHLDLYLWQIDFVATYLNSNNKFKVYMEQAPGFMCKGEEHLVYCANKTVYSMMAGAYNWEQELSMTYDSLGYY